MVLLQLFGMSLATQGCWPTQVLELLILIMFHVSWSMSSVIFLFIKSTQIQFLSHYRIETAFLQEIPPELPKFEHYNYSVSFAFNFLQYYLFLIVLKVLKSFSSLTIFKKLLTESAFFLISLCLFHRSHPFLHHVAIPNDSLKYSLISVRHFQMNFF